MLIGYKADKYLSNPTAAADPKADSPATPMIIK